ncbi:MAG: RecQ family ATP-dependent DNA helicase [Myxococcota bacterium]
MTRDPLALLRQHWGFDAFRPGQQKVIDALLAGHSAAAVFPTGGGKSLCYQLPALCFEGLTLVVSPLIALMKDQIDGLTRRGIEARRIESTLSPDAIRETMERARSGALRMLYVAPERFNNERFRRSLVGLPIALFAVDEAHCISEWGHSFRPDYLKLVRYARALGAHRVLALTATATPAVLEDVCRQFGIPPERAVVTPFYRENLLLRTEVLEPSARDAALLARLAPGAPTIVYVTQQKTAEEVAATLTAAGHGAVAYHAGLKPDERASRQERFMTGEVPVVVATIAFGMGVDKADIRAVIHYNLPKSLEGYAQEIGRAGRDGATSRCTLFACAADVDRLENFAYGDTPTEAAVSSLVEAIFEADDRVEVSFPAWAAEHDIRSVVLRTLFTYLELDGHIEAGTPFYERYRFQPLRSSAEMLASLPESERAVTRRILAQSKKARLWFDLDVGAAAKAAEVDRGRVVAVLDGLAGRGFVTLKTQGLRHPYRIVARPEHLDVLAAELFARGLSREQREVARLREVFDFVDAEDCQSARLAAHFGTPIDAPCGHCSATTEPTRPSLRAQLEEASRRAPEVPADVVVAARALADGGRTLDGPRAVARFLCGLPSPRSQRQRLTRNPLYGRLSSWRFLDVLAAVTGEPNR